MEAAPWASFFYLYCRFCISMIRILHQLVLPALIFISADVHSNDLLRDTTTMEQIRLGIDRIYNYEFDQAEYALNLLENNYPEHPVTSFYEGLIYYWKYYPLIPGQPGASEFEQAMQISWERAGRLKKNHQDIEGVFFELMSRAFIVMYYADNGRSSKAISHLGKIYRDILEGFDMQDEFKEFYFISGLYNYYREAYPEAYPIDQKHHPGTKPTRSHEQWGRRRRFAVSND